MCYYWTNHSLMIAYLLPVLSVVAIEIEVPVAHPVLLVETRVVVAYVRYPPSVFVAHVKDLAMVFRVRIEAHRPIAAVECESYVRQFLPSLRPVQHLFSGLREHVHVGYACRYY